MDFMEGLKRFLFGPQNRRHETQQNRDNEYPPQLFDNNDFFKSEEPSTDNPRNFDVFTDPLQMHQYFEHQMNEILKNFGFPEAGNSFFSGWQKPELGESGTFIEPGESPPQSGDLRDQFLKRGYEKPSQNPTETERIDKDIDDKVDIGNLDSILGKSNDHQFAPRAPSNPSGNFFFGQSFNTKIIHGPDGSVETHSTVRDNEGNEQTTITRRLGDKEVSIVTKKDKFGQKEVVENFINVEESEKNNFLKPQNVPRVSDVPHNYFPFDNFFK